MEVDIQEQATVSTDTNLGDGEERGSLFARTLENLRHAWRDIAEAIPSSGLEAIRPDLPSDQHGRLIAQMRACLSTKGGEVAARSRAAELGRCYLTLDDTGRTRFLEILATEFDVNMIAVVAAAKAVTDKTDADPKQMSGAISQLRDSLRAPRMELLTQFNGLPEGVKFLVDMRQDLLAHTKVNPQLKALDADMQSLLRAWFDVGFLELRAITWDAPAALLEKLIAYEAVHAIQSWSDLKHRLRSDRRCYAFFHPNMPDEPLIFVEVALVNGMSASISPLLDRSGAELDPRKADTAIFYSISNCQSGLVGISFGNFLIKRVVEELSHELPGIKVCATLSPIPGFRRWLDSQIRDKGDEVLTATERRQLAATMKGRDGESAEDMSLIHRALTISDWYQDPPLEKVVRPPLFRLCGNYLLSLREDGKRALDPVAHFHLSNGARMERLNWLADRSTKGLAQSAGLMINYLYRPGQIEENHEEYTGEGKVAAASSLRSLAKG